MKRRAYVNARLLDPATGLDAAGGALVEDGLIREAGPGIRADSAPEDAETVDCGGHCLAPGLIDMRVHLPGGHKETFGTAAEAAAAGGVTSLVCLPQPPVDSVAVAEFVGRRASNNVKIHAYGAITRECAGLELTEFGTLQKAGVPAFSDGDRAVADAVVMRRALSYAATFDTLIVQHPEEPRLAADGHANEGEVSTRLGLTGIPGAAEAMMIERDLRLVELTGARYHVAHVSTAAAVEVIRAAKTRGLPVSCDTAPHYFTLNESALEDYRTFAKVSPPLRGEPDRLAVIEGLRDGTIDAIASDHNPQDQDSKRLPFAQAESGIVGIETLLPLALALHHDEGVSLLDALRRMTSAPAALLGLKAGRLAAGTPADLVLFDPEAPWTIDTAAMRSKSKNSPFDGHRARGRALRTIADGREVHIGKGQAA